MIAYYEDLAGRYPIASIEDGLAEDDWAGWAALTAALGARVRLVGDDLFVTSTGRLGRGIAEGAANAILVKVNQVGTLTETLETVSLALRNGFAAVISPAPGRPRTPHRRSRGRNRMRDDQGRRAVPHRPHRQVQPAHPHRGGP